MAAYPEAKVVLVNRGMWLWHGGSRLYYKLTVCEDVEAWYQSCAEVVIWKGMWMPFTNLVPYFEPLLNFYCLTLNRKLVLGYFGATTPEKLLEDAQDVYRKHYQDIREACRSSRTPLLEMRTEHGWEPLAQFLNKKVPDEPFPVTNEKEAQQTISRGHRTSAVVKGLALALLYTMPPVAIEEVAVWYHGLVSRV